MTNMNCEGLDKYHEDGRCCDSCPAGSYVQAKCDGTKKTKCTKCEHGFHTATRNSLSKCLPCERCDSSNHLRKVKDCTAEENTVCECETGFYCSNPDCEHCLPVKHCIKGEGVKVQATRTSNTICAPCEKGTFSNVTDFYSTCRTHIRCEEIGRTTNTLGTPMTDAICGELKRNCHWILPAGLWSGLVLTALVLFGLICWRKKRKSYRKASSVPVEMVAATHVSLLELPLPSKELNGHCQESCTVECCKLPLFNPDIDIVVSCGTQDSVDSSLPIITPKASVSFYESKQTSAGYGTGNFLRTYSEPQEDEYCGT